MLCPRTGQPCLVILPLMFALSSSVRNHPEILAVVSACVVAGRASASQLSAYTFFYFWDFIYFFMRVLPTCVVCASQAPETLSLELQMTGSHQAGVTTELGLQEGHSVLNSHVVTGCGLCSRQELCALLLCSSEFAGPTHRGLHRATSLCGSLLLVPSNIQAQRFSDIFRYGQICLNHSRTQHCLRIGHHLLLSVLLLSKFYLDLSVIKH